MFLSALPPRKFETRSRAVARPRIHRRTLLLVTGIAALALALVFASFWPFARPRVLQDLRQASDSQVQVQTFHRTYFPFPGCVLEKVVFYHGPAEAKPLISIEKLTVRGSYMGLLSRSVARITAQGMLVSIPAFGSGQALHTRRSKITIDEIVANGATIEFASDNPDKQPLRFDVREASLRNVSWNGPLTYRVKVHNPEPPGEVAAEGKFGVWNQSNPGQSPISGEYTFEQADLSVYQGIAGRLSSSGTFGGTLAHIDIRGKTDVPDFEVKSGKNPTHLATEFSAYVDATNGDTFLKRVDANLGKTHIVAEGSVAGSADKKGKTAVIDLSADNARIEDILRLFVAGNRPPMSGSVTLRGRAEIPPGEEKFLKKVKVQGGFGVAAGKFSTPTTQENVNKLSAGARGEKDRSDPETVLTDLSGKVDLQGGTARFSDLSFGVPGAAARMQGTYNFLNERIDLHGQLQVESKISNTESGTKAFLLKMMEPLFKKKKKGEIVPVRISGTYHHPTFGLDVGDKGAPSKALPSTASKNGPEQ